MLPLLNILGDDILVERGRDERLESRSVSDVGAQEALVVDFQSTVSPFRSFSSPVHLSNVFGQL